MSDKNDFDNPSDDDFYDDALDDNFEFEDDNYDDVDLDDAFDENGDYVSGLEDDWDAEGADGDDWDDDAADEVGLPPKKVGLNFNTIMIVGAVLIGGYIMYSQTTKVDEPVGPQKRAVEKIATSLSMKGSFEGPGSADATTVSNDEVVVQEQKNTSDGFLFGENTIDANTDIVSDAPPMPSPISSDQEDVALEGNAVDISELLNENSEEVAANEVPNAPPKEDIMPEEDKNDSSLSLSDLMADTPKPEEVMETPQVSEQIEEQPNDV